MILNIAIYDRGDWGVLKQGQVEKVTICFRGQDANRVESDYHLTFFLNRQKNNWSQTFSQKNYLWHAKVSLQLFLKKVRKDPPHEFKSTNQMLFFMFIYNDSQINITD